MLIRLTNIALVVAFLVCPLAWYVAAINGSPRINAQPLMEENYPLDVYLSQPPPTALAITDPEKYRMWLSLRELVQPHIPPGLPPRSAGHKQSSEKRGW